MASDISGGAPARGGQRRVLVEWAVVAAISTAALILMVLGSATARLDSLVYDAVTRFSLRSPSEDIVVVAIDNRSIASLGRWPWPRTHHEALLRRLAEARPRAVAYDVLFLEPDRAPATDVELAQAMSALPVYLPLSIDVPGEDGAPFTLLPPTPPLASAAAGIGQVNVEFDGDGVVRRAFLSEGGGSDEWPHLMELLARAKRGTPSRAWEGGGPVAAGTAAEGLRRARPVMIGFSGHPGEFRTISFVDLLRGETPSVFLRDRLVLVGATADGLGDRYATPLSGNAEVMPGVELQANLLDTLLTGREVTPLGRGAVVVLSLAPLWLLLVGFLLLKPRANMLLGLGLSTVVLAASVLALAFGRVWAPPTAALAGLLLVYPLWSWRRLEASSAFMVAELRRFAAEPDPLPTGGTSSVLPRGEVIARQMDLMEGALGRARDLRQFLSDIVQGLPDATVVAGAEARVLVANRAGDSLFTAVLGGSPVGRTLDELAAAFEVAPADPESGDVEMSAPDGRTFTVRRTALVTSGGAPAGWIVRYADITGLKAAGRQREDILQLLTHDMRSPQVSILALLEGRDLELPTFADRIRGYASRTLKLADDFVHLARAETSTLTLEATDLAEVVIDAVDDLWPQSQAKGVTVTGPALHDGVLVAADRSLLTRVMINLIDNAIKFTDPGGRITCEVRPDAARPECVICDLADNGRGMSAEEVERVFDRFQRSAGAHRVQGVGLGLAFVQTVVQRHGGDISCESRPGAGTRFRVRLPRWVEDEDPVLPV
jgi:CHASE2 domain-containing sensor protein/signal transduction histidine kinase